MNRSRAKQGTGEGRNSQSERETLRERQERRGAAKAPRLRLRIAFLLFPQYSPEPLSNGLRGQLLCTITLRSSKVVFLFRGTPLLLGGGGALSLLPVLRVLHAELGKSSSRLPSAWCKARLQPKEALGKLSRPSGGRHTTRTMYVVRAAGRLCLGYSTRALAIAESELGCCVARPSAAAPLLCIPLSLRTPPIPAPTPTPTHGVPTLPPLGLGWRAGGLTGWLAGWLVLSCWLTGYRA